MAEYDFSPLKNAGITPGLTAKIVQVSRVTASQWCNGHATPHRLLGNRVHEYLRLVNAALSMGLLPLKEYPGRANLLSEITKALATAKAATATAPLATS